MVSTQSGVQALWGILVTKQLIAAHNHHLANVAARQRGLAVHDWQYVQRVDMLRGCARGLELIVAHAPRHKPTQTERRYFDDVMSMARTRDCKLIYERLA